MATYYIDTAALKEKASELRAGDRVYLSGTVYTSRDAAHKRIFEALDSNSQLPYALEESVVYYAGPTPTPENLPIGSCGPTTSGRMDAFAPRLLDLGMRAMIGKGQRNKDVCEAIIRNKAVYFCAVGGAGALAAKCVEKCQVIAYEDLGCESVKKLEIKEFPLIVAIDCQGGNLFER